MQTLHTKLISFMSAGIISLVPVPTLAYTLTTFGPSAYNINTTAMDAALGIKGMSIESFNDSVLIPRLSVEFQNPNAGPFTTLPTSPFNDSLQLGGSPLQYWWDGSPSLINRPNQDNTTPYASTTFSINGGTSRFGIGLADFEAVKWNQTELLINGKSYGLVSNLPNYADGYVGGNRALNLYLSVSVASGDPPITSVKFNMLGTNDAQLFDHIAIDLSSPAATVLKTDTYGAHTYKLIGSDSGSRLTWADAQAAASAMGGNLVTVNDAAENTFLLNTFGAKAISAAPSGAGLVSLWLGLNDAAQEGHVVWVDGTSSAYTNFKPGEPAGNLGDDDYIGMIVGPGFGTPGQWHDIVSDFRLNDVTFGVVEIVPTASAADCLFNWAETNYAGLFSPAGAATQTLLPYTYRYYKNTNAYVGISSANNDVYYLGPDGNLVDAGSLSGWLTLAKCQ